MKKIVHFISLLTFCIISFQGNSQTLQGSCIKANFGIDGYIYANGSEYVGAGSIINTNSADDWFYNPSIYPGTGLNVIDTSGLAYYNSILQSGNNTFFASPMSLPSNSVVAGKRWQDATYARDYFGGTGATDSTSYTSASKNGEPLDEWATGPANVTPKNDLIDCYSHMRRDGELATSPLWLFLGFSRISNNGESYFDGELFAKDVDYDPVTGFTSAGDEEGHTAWQFDAEGNITEIGDIVVTVNMSTNGAPTFEVRIWVRRFDFQNIDPATFDFGPNFDGSSNSSVYGYADIVPPIGNEFGCGVTNEETWVAPPWGTLSSGGNYASFYESGQFVEIGLNLFEFGIDPQVVEGMDGCDLPFSNILFKSRASNSFTAQLKDFSGPFGFLNLNEVEISLAADSITCFDPVIPITVANNFPNYYYEWSTPDGNITANINDTLIYVDAPGMYILASAFVDGCELKYDTIYVDAYTDLPPANILSDTIYDCNNVIANLSAADNGFIYSWLGPSNVSYFGQSISVTDPGIYYLYVQNQYGCVGIDSIYVIEYPCQDVSANNISTTVILDTLPPSFTPPPAITIDCGFDYLDLGITGDVFDESDNCDPVIDAIFTDSFNTDGYCSGTGQIIRNWSLTDDCGNVFSATQEIILIDTVAPVFAAPDDVTINCDADFSDLSLTGETPTVIDECDTISVNITYADSFETDFNCNGQTRIQRIWSAIDDCGNESLDTQMIMMMDTVGPQIFGVPYIPFVSCDSVPEAPTVIVVDNCDANPTVVFTENTTSAVCPNSYILIRIWTATDNCGNQTVLTQELNVEDISDPTILSFPQDLTISCDSIPPPFEPIAEDDCDSEIDIDYSEQQIFGNCEGNYELIRSWIWTDDCDNESSAFQTITVQDNTPPTFTVPADVTFDCTIDLNDLSIVGDVTDEADNCTSVIGEATFIDNANYSCVGTGVIERTWSLADACGNLTEYVQTITISDTTPPVFSVPNDITIDCQLDENNLTITGDVLDEFDDCDNTLGQATYQDIIDVNPGCSLESNITRIWSLADDCGNITIDTQYIFIVDTIAPNFSMPSDITIDCHVDIENFTIVGEAANGTDNCDQNLSPITYTDIYTADGTCIGTGTIERIWSISDECGNTNIDTQLIVLIDTFPPVFSVPADISLDCEQDPFNLNLTGDVIDEFDNCFINIGEATYVDSILNDTPCEGSMVIFRTWTLEDGCGNITSETQTISVEDTTAPEFSTPPDITLNCFSELQDTLVVGIAVIINDNCSSTIGNTFHVDSILVNDSCNYLIQRHWFAEDVCGNISTDTQMIMIADTIAPILNGNLDTMVIGCDSIPPPATLTATDNCDSSVDVIFSETIIPGGCSNAYTIVRTWTATDRCGNETTYSQNLEVQDNAEPIVFAFPADVTVSCDSIPEVATQNVEDNCTVNITLDFSETITNGACPNDYIITRTWTWSDNCNNTSTYSQNITVYDDTPPFFTVPANITVDCTTDVNDLNFTGNISNASDNCDTQVGNAVYTDQVFSDSFCGESRVIHRTWSLSDSCGNTLFDLQVITVIDTLLPSFTTPNDVTINCGDDPNDLNLVGDVIDEFDSCTAAIGEATYVDSILVNTPCEGASIIYRLWTLADDCGNELQDTQTITIIDTNAPIFSNIPLDSTVTCDAVPVAIDPIVTDDCASLTLDYSEETINGSCPNDFVLRRKWMATDACGNQDSVIQILTVIDTVAPVLTNVPVDVTLNCEDLPVVPVLNFTDNCSDTVFVVFSENTNSGACIDIQIVTRNWTATDACGNETSITQQITLNNCSPEAIVTLPPDTTLCEFETITFEVNMIGNYPTPVYQWQYTTDTTLSWTNISGATNPTFSINSVTLADSGYYQVLISNNIADLNDSLCSVISDITFLEVLPHAPLTNLNDTICDGQSLFFNGQNLTSSGQYTANLTAANGCDSIVIIDLIVNPTYELTHPDTICFGENYPFGNSIYSTTGTYSFTFSTINNCDSLVHLELFVYDEVQTNLTDTICDTEILIFNGQNLTTSGQYTAVLTAVNGCDSTVIIDLWVNPIYELTHPDTICFGENYQFGNNTFTTTENHSFTFSTIDGCDSLVHLELFVYDEIQTYLNDTICDGETLIFNSQTLTTSGQYTEILTAANGCDSTVIIDLIVNPTYELTQPDTICFGTTYDFGNSTYSTSGTYSFTFSTVNGCDSLVHLELEVDPAITTNLTEEICDGENYNFNGEIISITGQYIDTLTAANSCDSFVILDLTVFPVYEIFHADTICEGDNYLFGNDNYTTSGSHSFTFQTINGCDSLVHLDLVMNDTFIVNMDIIICDGDSYNFGNNSLTQPGVYTDSLSTITGCDSLIILNLLVVEPTNETIEIDLCYGESYDGISYFQTSYLSEFLTNIYGCDSIVNTNIYVSPEAETIFDIDICEGDTYQNIIYNQEAILIDSLMTTNGCDSIVITNINVHPEYEFIETISLCTGTPYQGIVYSNDTVFVDNYQSEWGCDSMVIRQLQIRDELFDSIDVIICLGETYQSTAYTDDTILTEVGTSINGCDSTFYTKINVIFPSDTSIQVHICAGESYMINSTNYSQSGSYTQIIQSINGCDSTINLELFVWENYESTSVNYICEGDFYNGNQYFTSTVLIDSLTSIDGCDSVLINEINVLEPSTETQIIQICEGASYQGVIYSNDTTLVDTLQNLGLCDSIVFYNVTLVTEINNSISQTLCYGENWNGTIYTSDTIFTNTYTSSGGCDSIITTSITVLPLDQNTLAIDLCEGETVFVGGAYQSTNGTYFDTLSSVNGCDSFVTTIVTVYPVFEENSELDICYGDSILIFGIYRSNTGNYVQNLTTQNGCDSTISITLNVGPPPANTFHSFYLCEGDSMFVGGAYQTTSGVYVDSLVSSIGCDSLITTTLELVNPIATYQVGSICEGDSLIVDKSTYYTAGNYIDTLTSYTGCDSIVHFELTVYPVYEFIQNVEICEGETYFVGGALQNSSGVYYDSYSTINGCDSNWITNLLVQPTSYLEQEFELCEGESMYVGGANQTTSGIYYDVYPNSIGCDSLVMTTLVFHPTFSNNFEITICQNDSILIGANYQNTAGVYVDQYTTIQGCDSIITTILNIYDEEIDYYVEESMCVGDSIFIAGEWQYEAGIFVENFSTTNGCDSIITTTLNVNEPNFVIGESAEICFGDEVQLYLEGAEGVDNITWYPDFSLSCNDCPNPIAYPDVTTTYTVTYPTGCNDEILETEVTVVVIDQAPIELVETELTILEGDTVILMVADADSSFNYTWIDNRGNVVCDSCFTFMVSPRNSITYTVIANDPTTGCPGYETVIVNVRPPTCEDGTLEVANVIFPQSGGYGELLEIKYDRVEIKTLRIFNRWGELVFETNDVEDKWDGTFRGQLLNPAVYVYYIIGACDNQDQTKFIYTGNVTLIH